MSSEDPWVTGARLLRVRRAEEAAETPPESPAEERERRRVHRQVDNREAAELQAAIDQATADLEDFMRERGAAAQDLIDAYGGPYAYVSFGRSGDKKRFRHIYLGREGIREVTGTISVRGYKPTTMPTPATASDAVWQYAFHGKGSGNPKKIRNLVQWLTKEVDIYAPLELIPGIPWDED